MTPDNTVIYQSVERLASIGPKRALALQKSGIATIEDLMYYFPRRYLDRSTVTPIRKLQTGQDATVVGRIIQSDFIRGRKNRFVLVLSDDTSLLTCVWFSRLTFWQKIFKKGEWLAVSGKVTYFNGLQMSHPDFDRLGPDKEGGGVHTGTIIPVYPSSELLTRVGLDSRGFRRIFARLVKHYPDVITDPLPQEILARQKLVDINRALRFIHFPENVGSLKQARKRLKFDELFFLQLMLARRKYKLKIQRPGISFDKVGKKVEQLLDKLPFELTKAQKRVLHEIRADMKAGTSMNRLLQGDVGSGKTIIALVTMLIAIENGYQSALMAPTEILAEQHFLTIHNLLEEIDVHTVLLIGGQSQKVRRDALQDVSSGRANIVVGTHALIQEQVDFADLGLVIIDEQHRFGVMQRANLQFKSANPDVLVMTATPIPRTLSLTIYGDLDVSVLDELPAGRKPVVTSWRRENRRSKIYEFVRNHLAKGAQAFVVFPLVEESEKSDLKAAVDSYKKMQAGFFQDFQLGLLHGRMKAEEKEKIMAGFKAGKIDMLISTTVVEVGVDVPNASIMVIEHAERFGLTQLHQLRGRVGRGDVQSYCILIGYGQLSSEAVQRLKTMAETTDGFKIAEKDLEIRGPGEYFGTKQHGIPALVIADVQKDKVLLQAARKEAFQLIQRDPQLKTHQELITRGYFLRRFENKVDLTQIA